MIRHLYYLLTASVLLLTLGSCRDDEIDDHGGDTPEEEQVKVTRKVAIICNSQEKALYQNTFEWFDMQIQQAQDNQPLRLTLEPEWVFEEDPALQEQSLFDRLLIIDAKQYAAIIGPTQTWLTDKALAHATDFYNQNLRDFAPILVPGVMPTDMHRQYDDKPYVWFLSESDMAEAEMMLAVARRHDLQRVSVLTTDDAFGRTYFEKMPFMAAEWRLGLAHNVRIDPQADEATLLQAFNNLYPEGQVPNTDQLVVVASSNREHYKILDREAKRYGLNNSSRVHLIFADNACYPAAEGIYANAYALAPYTADADFARAFMTRVLDIPAYQQAQFYDALLMAFLSAWSQQVSQTTQAEVIGQLSSHQSQTCRWDAQGIAQALKLLHQGQYPQMQGASGRWEYKLQAPLHSPFVLWSVMAGDPTGEVYPTQEYSKRTSSDNPVDWWTPQDPDDSASAIIPDTISYGPVEHHKAILVASSYGITNYRHTADVLAMYWLLRHHGYADEDILLVADTTLLHDKGNHVPGDIHNTIGGPNLADSAMIDYCNNQLDYKQIGQLIKGQATSPEQPAFEVGPEDNLFIYWCGHGQPNNALDWRDEQISCDEFCSWFTDLTFRKSMLVIEACYSGAVAARLQTRGLLCTTAASAFETSSAYLVKDPLVSNQYISNEFSHEFLRTVTENPDISLGDLYVHLYTHTRDSHVCISDIRHYGCLVNQTMREYLK